MKITHVTTVPRLMSAMAGKHDIVVISVGTMGVGTVTNVTREIFNERHT